MSFRNVSIEDGSHKRCSHVRSGSARAGLTLVEVAIAVMILGLVLGSALAVTGRGFRYNSDMRLSAKSSQILQQKMEDLRLMTWSQLQALPSTFTDPSDTNAIFTCTISTNAYATYSGATTVMRVTLRATWQNLTYKTTTNTLTTLFSNGGLNKYTM